MEANKRLILKYKIWLETTEKAFGDGPCEILCGVDRLGSLRAAAERMNMSYSHAWNLVRRLEQRLGFKLLHFQVGGRSGGGASLTPEARNLLNRYQGLKQEAESALAALFRRYFGESL